jgi:hypothetical protein
MNFMFLPPSGLAAVVTSLAAYSALRRLKTTPQQHPMLA